MFKTVFIIVLLQKIQNKIFTKTKKYNLSLEFVFQQTCLVTTHLKVLGLCQHITTTQTLHSNLPINRLCSRTF